MVLVVLQSKARLEAVGRHRTPMGSRPLSREAQKHCRAVVPIHFIHSFSSNSPPPPPVNNNDILGESTAYIYHNSYTRRWVSFHVYIYTVYIVCNTVYLFVDTHVPHHIAQHRTASRRIAHALVLIVSYVVKECVHGYAVMVIIVVVVVVVVKAWYSSLFRLHPLSLIPLTLAATVT